MYNWNQVEQEIIAEMMDRRPDLGACLPSMLAFHEALGHCYEKGHILFTCGNGGSNADAHHIVGELCKSFERQRPLKPDFATALLPLPYGVELSRHLEAGLPAIALGLNSPLKTAIENDCPMQNIAFAQELNALMHPGDMLLAISTSGNAANCMMAMSVARARGGVVASLTGPQGGKMSSLAHVAIKTPGASTKEIQEAHVVLWHTLCCLIEGHYFPMKRQ